MTESGFDTSGFWYEKDWVKHIKSGSGINRYGTGIYNYRNEQFIELLKKNNLSFSSVFEFAGAGGFLAKMILAKFDIKCYEHTDYLDICVEKAKENLSSYSHANVYKLNIASSTERGKVDFSKFDLITSTSVGYIAAEFREIIGEMKKDSYLLFSYPVGYASEHMMRFPNPYELLKYFSDLISIIDLKQIASIFIKYLKYPIYHYHLFY